MKKLLSATVVFLFLAVPVALAQPTPTPSPQPTMAAPAPAPVMAVAAPAMVAVPVMTPAPAMAVAPQPAMVASAPVAPQPATTEQPVESTPEDAMGVVTTDAPATAPPMAEATMEAAAPTTSSPQVVVNQEQKKDTWWQTLLGGLIQILLLFVAAIATALGPYAIKWIANKAKISNQETQMTMNSLYDQAIYMGVNFATQQANKLNNNPDAKGERLKWATTKAQELIKEWKLPEKSAKWIEDAIEAKLGETNGPKEPSEEPSKPADG